MAMESFSFGDQLPFNNTQDTARQPVLFPTEDCLNEGTVVETPQVTGLFGTTFAGVRNLRDQEVENGDHVPMRATDVDLVMSNDPVQSTLCPEPPNKKSRRSNWTRAETAFLVECKKQSVSDRGSRCGTSWEAISEMFQGRFDNICGVKSSQQCRRRWDTLTKSYKKIKDYCAINRKEYPQLTKQELSGLKLDTILEEHWFETIDKVCPPTSRTRSGQPGQLANEGPSNMLQSIPERFGSDQLLFSSMLDEGPSNLPQIMRSGSGQLLSSSMPDEGPSNPLPEATPAMSPTPRRRRHRIRQRAVPGFSGLPELLKRTLLDCILCKNFLSNTFLKSFCQWLAIVHDADSEDIMRCLHKLRELNLIEMEWEDTLVDTNSLRKYQDFASKAVRDNPRHDIHLNIRRDGRSILDSSILHQGLRVLSFFKCYSMTEAQLSGLPNLRSLTFEICPNLKKVTGWEQLKRLGWLEMRQCGDVLPELEFVTSLRTLKFRDTGIPLMPVFGQCFLLLCELHVYLIPCLVTTGDLGNLRCLQHLHFINCRGLASIHASLSELQFLIHLIIEDCKDLKTIPYLGRLKRLRGLCINRTGIESIPGIEEVESLVQLRCTGSQLSWLPDLDRLTWLRVMFINGTPLYNNKYSKYYKREGRYDRDDHSSAMSSCFIYPEDLMTDVDDDISEGSVYATSNGDPEFDLLYPSDEEVSD